MLFQKKIAEKGEIIMNIFVLNECPTISAQEMIDKHVVKMPTESMQMISTTLDYLGLPCPYRPVMLNHPCTIWARKSRNNFQWLVSHCLALCKEYTVRYNKTHKVELTLSEYADSIEKALDYLPREGLTPFAQAMPDSLKDDDACIAYQNYYLHSKWPFASWKTERPTWWPHNHIKKMRTR